MLQALLISISIVGRCRNLELLLTKQQLACLDPCENLNKHYNMLAITWSKA